MAQAIEFKYAHISPMGQGNQKECLLQHEHHP